MDSSGTPGGDQAAFNIIAALTPETNHLGPHEDWLLGKLPSSRGSVLEIGCGTGQLTRRLATSFDRTVAIDLSEGMIAEARQRSRGTPGVDYIRADMFEWLGNAHETFDCIVTVATLHHVDLKRALREMAQSLAPGGRLLVLDLLERDWLRHPFVNSVAWIAARGREAVIFRGIMPWRLRSAWRKHGSMERYLDIEEARTLMQQELPGARVEEHLMWRYSVVWDKPEQALTPPDTIRA